MRAAVIALAAGVSAAATAAAAEAPARFNPAMPVNRQLMPAFSYATVEPVLAQIGAKYRRAGTAPGKPMLHVQLPNGRTAVLIFGLCSPDGATCKALSIESYWTPIAKAAPERTRGAVEGFNRTFSFAKAFIAGDGRPMLQRYLTADFGFVRGNLAVNLLNFAAQADRFAADVLGPLESNGAR